MFFLNSPSWAVIPFLQPKDAMPINGLMVTLSRDSALAGDACDRIARRPELERGERQDRWLPVVADTAGDRQAREVHGWLESLDGVDQVDVILVGFDEPNS